MIHRIFWNLLLFFLSANVLCAASLPSVLRENFKIVLSSNQAGPILLYVQEGDYVVLGNELFGIETKELELSEQLAEVQWKQAKIKLERIQNPYTEEELKKAELLFEQTQRLYETGAISEDAYEMASYEHKLAIRPSRTEDILIAGFEVETALLQWQLAKEALRHATVLAPTTGRIHKVLVEPNEWVQPGKNILELINVHPLKIDINVPLGKVHRISTDKPLTVSVSTGRKEIKTEGIVKFISDSADAVSQTVLVRIEIDNMAKIFKPGMYVQVFLP